MPECDWFVTPTYESEVAEPADGSARTSDSRRINELACTLDASLISGASPEVLPLRLIDGRVGRVAGINGETRKLSVGQPVFANDAKLLIFEPIIHTRQASHEQVASTELGTKIRPSAHT